MPFPSFSKREKTRDHSNGNQFDFHENGRAGETHFHMNGFARRLILTEAKITRKWPIKEALFDSLQLFARLD